MRLRLVKGTSILATTRTTLKSGRVKATLRAKHALAKGKRYTLRIAVTHKGGVLGLSRTV